MFIKPRKPSNYIYNTVLSKYTSSIYYLPPISFLVEALRSSNSLDRHCKRGRLVSVICKHISMYVNTWVNNGEWLPHCAIHATSTSRGINRRDFACISRDSGEIVAREMCARVCRKTEKENGRVERGKDDSEITRLTLKFYLASNLRSQRGMTAAPPLRHRVCCVL